MNLLCAPKGYGFTGSGEAVEVVLYGRTDRQTRGSAGSTVKDEVEASRLRVAPKAWDFLSLALAVTAADLAGHRTGSPDGWTREFDLRVAVSDPVFWNEQRELVSRLLRFLTTDHRAGPAPPTGSRETNRIDLVRHFSK